MRVLRECNFYCSVSGVSGMYVSTQLKLKSTMTSRDITTDIVRVIAVFILPYVV